MTVSFTIDVHHHILPDVFRRATNDEHSPVGGFAALPLPDVDGALRALEYGLDVLKLDGVVLFSNARGIAADTLRRLYPYLRRDLAVACRHEVETSAELYSEESRAVLADNALKLFPRLATRADAEESAQTLRTRSP